MLETTVLDASVAINVLGCGEARAILDAFPGRIIVPDVTSREVLRDPLDPNSRADPLVELIDAKLIERLPLAGGALSTFMRLVGAAHPDDLGDGESAAIALAEQLGAAIALDDGKARRIVQHQFPQIRMLSSVSLFATVQVAGTLGRKLADAVFSALVNSRMRVLPEDEAWVLALLGERAALCPSLKKRRR
jgi:predicted nucleic acid-binding protein